jgi:hypothetical protein
MKLSAIIATFVLGTSSVALADQNNFDNDYDRDEAPVLRDHRMPERDARDGQFWRGPEMPVDRIGPPIQRGWTTIARYERLRGGSDSVQLYEPMRARSLMLQANRGMSFVDSVEITFSNGHRRVLQVNRRLGQNEPITIDLPGRTRMVSRIVVFGRSRWGSSYNVLAA